MHVTCLRYFTFKFMYHFSKKRLLTNIHVYYRIWNIIMSVYVIHRSGWASPRNPQWATEKSTQKQDRRPVYIHICITLYLTNQWKKIFLGMQAKSTTSQFLSLCMCVNTQMVHIGICTIHMYNYKYNYKGLFLPGYVIVCFFRVCKM
jgi:hypothetical protein